MSFNKRDWNFVSAAEFYGLYERIILKSVGNTGKSANIL